MTEQSFTFKKRRYRGKMDAEVVALCNAMNACPGIITIGSCSGHNKRPLLIHFYSTNMAGLFFLVRCADRRYWQYGHRWTISLSANDSCARLDKNGCLLHFHDEIPKAGDILPTLYCLESIGTWGNRTYRTKGPKAYTQAASLVENMLQHLTLDAFMHGYGLDMNQFQLKAPRIKNADP